ncbi:MAG: dTDP-4-dehydrorhamnose reductase [Cyanobacteria bacterium P01_C01_bin.89]
MRILLTGAKGQLGQELQPLMAPLGEVIIADRTVVDLSQTETLYDQVAALEPDVIVNAAAYTAVDKAESEMALAQAVNGTAPGILGQVARNRQGFLFHVSTDYVFNGSQGRPYRETDPTDPLGTYGTSKLAGEQAIAQTAPQNSAVIRTAWVYGTGGTGNFVKTMVRLGENRPELRVVADQIGSPTWTGDLAGAIAQLIPQRSEDLAGTYHYTNSGAASWYDFAVAIFEEAKILGADLAIQQVVPITTADYPTPAQRPSYSVLAGEKIAAKLGQPAPHWRQGLRKMLAEYLQRSSP